MRLSKILLVWASLFLLINAKADDMIEIEDIWLSQNIHVTGDTLCQDGQFVYFKDKKNCEEAMVDWNCQADLKISPLHFIEKIELPSGQSVTQFYNIKKQYDYIRYELTSFYPIKSYDLVESKQIEFPICKGMVKKESMKLKKIRQANVSELDFVNGLIKSGVTVLNAPYGSFAEMAENLKATDLLAPQKLFPKLKSPLCNNRLNYDDIVSKASGEWSGHGIIQIASLNEWQNQSGHLNVSVKKDQSHNKIFEFYCKSEGENEL